MEKPVQVQGTFPAQRFFDTLALILSRREGVNITVKVRYDDEGEEVIACEKSA